MRHRPATLSAGGAERVARVSAPGEVGIAGPAKDAPRETPA